MNSDALKVPNVWPEPFDGRIERELREEAMLLFRRHALPESMEEWKIRREELRAQIKEHAFVNYDKSLDLNYTVTKTIECDGYKVLCIHFQSRPGILVTGNLYVPEGDGPFPAVLNVHGHWTQGRLAERVQARGHSLAKNGYVCLSVDAWGSGERSDVHCNFEYHGGLIGGSLLFHGETLMGAQIADNMRAVDLLCSLPFVDSERLGVTGASGGGNQTMWVAAMDERLKAAMPVVSVGSFESYVMRANCICECLPGGLTFTEESGVLALVAPRAMKICNALQDSNPTFFVSEMLRSFKNAREVFRLYGAEDKLTYQAFPLPHGYWPDVREAMLGFFDQQLKGKGNGAPRSEIPFKALPEEEVMVFEKGKRPAFVKSIEAYLRERGAENLQKSVNAGDLKSYLDIFGMNKETLAECWSSGCKDEWNRWSLKGSGRRVIPVLVRPGNKKEGNVVVLSSEHGKASLAGGKLLDKALSEASFVVLFDGMGTGENGDTTKAVHRPFHELSRALLWLGRTVIGEWASDYSLVAQFVSRMYPGHRLSFGASGEIGIAACVAALISDASSVYAENLPQKLAWRDGENGTQAVSTMAILVPKFATWGDMQTLRAFLSLKTIELIEL